MTFIVWDIGMKEMKERSKTLNSMIIMNTIISLVCIKRSHASLLEPQQNDLSNPEVYSCFAKIVNS